MSEAPTAAERGDRHLPGLESAQQVATTAFRKTQLLAADAARLHEIAVFTGEPGLGKTFAVDHWVRSQPCPWVWLDMPPKPSPKEVVVRLTRALQGSCDSRTPAYDLADELCALLAEHSRVVVIDEAQNLAKEGLAQLRYLHDRPDACWALFFVGATGCAQVLKAHPELHSRVARWVHFTPLEGDELLQALRAFHPLLAAADTRLLARIDETYAKGVFRRWARLTEIAVPLARRRGDTTLTTDTARAALAAMPQ